MGLVMAHGGAGMQVSVTEAKARLTALVHLAEAGDEVVLTRHGRAVVRLVPIKPVQGSESRRALLEAARASGAAKAKAGPNAVRSQDFLYGDDGLPE
jgi:prevent-host-death family protein